MREQGRGKMREREGDWSERGGREINWSKRERERDRGRN
jgi:hypothetical protein